MQRMGHGKAGFKGLEGDGRRQAGGHLGRGDDDGRDCNHAVSLNEAAVETGKTKDPLEPILGLRGGPDSRGGDLSWVHLDAP